MYLIKLIGITIGIAVILGSIKLYKEAEKIEMEIQSEERKETVSESHPNEEMDL